MSRKYQDTFFEVGNDISGHYMMIHADWTVHFYFIGNRQWAVEMYSFLARETVQLNNPALIKK